MVLLENQDGVLPLDAGKSTAVIGPLARNQHDMLGPWWGRGDDGDVVTVFDGIDEQNTAPTTYAQGCELSNGEVPFDADPDRRIAIRRAASPTPASPRRRRSRRRRTRSCSRSARRAR